MKLTYLRQTKLNQLRAGVETNIALYRQDKPWLEDVLGEDYCVSSRVEIGALPELLEPEDGELHDRENAILIHRALRELTPTQASDARL